MKEKERKGGEKKNETEKGVKKEEKLQCGNRTHDLLICSRHYHRSTASGFNHTYICTIFLYIADLDFDDLTVAVLALDLPNIRT